MLFSAGTFLFVAAAHILPDVMEQEGSGTVPWAVTLSCVTGILLPALTNFDDV